MFKLPSLRQRQLATEPPLTIRRRRSAPAPSGLRLARTVSPSTAGARTPTRVVAPVALGPAGAAGQSRYRRVITLTGRSLWTPRMQLSAALLSWVAWATIVYALSPDEPAARAGFFMALFAGIFFTLVPALRVVWLQFAHSRLYREAAGMHATRQALEVAVLCTLNTFLQVQRAWTPLTAVLLCVVFIIIELIALSRR